MSVEERIGRAEDTAFSQGWEMAVKQIGGLFHDAGLLGEYGLHLILKHEEFTFWVNWKRDQVAIEAVLETQSNQKGCGE